MNDIKASPAYVGRFQRVCRYIARHLDEPLSLETLSAIAHSSPYHFHRQFSAYNTARIKANSETYVEVPELLDIKQILAKKVASTEKVTIANAILRKKYYVDLLKLANAIIYKYNLDVQKKQKFDEQSMIAIEQELDRKFPADSKRAYSADDVDKAREKARKANEVIVSDPIGLVGTNALTEYATQLADYISTIDTILSVANASTVVEFEY